MEHTGGIHCSQAMATCEEAIRLAESESPPQVILLDIGLPGMNGIQGIEVFKSLLPTTHIIILTIYDDNNKVLEAICAGASGYLLKDSPPEKIIESIQEVMAGGAHDCDPPGARMFREPIPKKSDYVLTEREEEICSTWSSRLTNSRSPASSFSTSYCEHPYQKPHQTALNTRSEPSQGTKETL